MELWKRMFFFPVFLGWSCWWFRNPESCTSYRLGEISLFFIRFYTSNRWLALGISKNHQMSIRFQPLIFHWPDMQICNQLLSISGWDWTCAKCCSNSSCGFEERKQNVDTYTCIYDMWYNIMVKISFFISSIQKNQDGTWIFNNKYIGNFPNESTPGNLGSTPHPKAAPSNRIFECLYLRRLLMPSASPGSRCVGRNARHQPPRRGKPSWKRGKTTGPKGGNKMVEEDSCIQCVCISKYIYICTYI